MKRITLTRHAKSSWKDSVSADFDRPLNQRGLRDAPRMGARLRRLGIVPERVYSSPARRAETTARLLFQEVGLPPDRIHLVADLYGADPGAVYYLIHGLDPGLTHVAIVGHNPTLQWMVSDLVGQSIEAFVTCAVAHLTLDVPTWDQVVPGCGTLVHFLTPRDPADRFDG